ncbi:hypothetical protein [Winogradskyella ursingii]|uniref:hypothetical protein n=1 Tax=Winogradskyella ursingii TaxID=2686079 RepID=UPI0015C7ECD5|nr:hypothetical protein [Winogradskyella ursingii]
MSITESNVAPIVIKQTSTKVGNLYFLNHLVVAEFNEGAHLDLESFRAPLKDIIRHFGSLQPFGLIANRVNSYSISLLDMPEVTASLPNLAAYGIVTHNEAGRMNAIIETKFCESTDFCFDNLYEGLDTVYRRVKNKIQIALN